MSGSFDNGAMTEFVSAVRELAAGKNEDKRYLTGTVSHTDLDGTVWVNVAGGVSAMPVSRSTASYSPGDVVSFSIENGVASMGGNVTDPAAGGDTVVHMTKQVDIVENHVEHIERVKADRVETDILNAAVADIETAMIGKADVDDLTAAEARIGNLEADHVSTTDLQATNARIGTIEADYLKAADMQAETARVDSLLAGKATVNDLNAATGRITQLESADARITGRLEAAEADIDDLEAEDARITNLVAGKASINDLNAATGRITVLESTKANISDIEANYITADNIEATYMHADMTNSDVAWIQNGVIANGAISSAMINDVSANKLTAGTINGSVINVTNLNADNITAGTLNGQRIGAGSLSLDKLSESVYTEAEVDAKLSDMQAEIDGAIETWTGTEVPTLNNAPASAWTTTADRDKHVGDVYFNTTSGYNYRFTKSGSTYSWLQIKDTDITNALQRIQTAEGKITTFDSDISTLKTDTGELKTKTQSLETSLGDKVDTTTFNELEDTVDGHSQTISQHTTAISNKADTSTVNQVTNRVSKNEQDISGINTTIGQLQTTVASKADGSTVTTISNKLNTVETTVNGHTETLSSVQSTLSTKADNSTVATLRSEYNETKTTVSGHETRLTATESVANGVRTDLNNLEIGGRNLLRFTGHPTYAGDVYNAANREKGWCRWNTAATISRTSDGIRYTNNSESSNPSGFCIPFVFDDAAVGGEDYVLSFDYKSNYASLGKPFLLKKTGGNTPTSSEVPIEVSEDSWKHFSQVLRWPSTQGYVTYALLIPYYAGKDRYLEIKDGTAKLERGNKPTDWTPAPEDLETEVTSLKTDYATYKQTTTEALSEIGTTYATKTELGTETSNRQTAIQQLNNAIALKANSSDVYTKAQSDGLISTEVTNRNAAITAKANEITASVSETYTTKTEFNNLEVGGRNLVIDSKSFRPGIVQNSSTMASSVENGIYKMVVSNGNTANWNSSWWPNKDTNWSNVENNLSEGDSFVISFEMRAVGSTKKPTIYIKPGMGYYSMSGELSESWSIVYYAGTWKDAETINPHLGWSGISTASTYYIKSVKVERGNKPTDWTPAPEDFETDLSVIESRVSTNETSIRNNSNAIELRAKSSDVYTKTDVDGKITQEVNDRNSAIEQSASAINLSVQQNYTTKTEFNALEVGGRNLLRGSSVLGATGTTHGWINNGGTPSLDTVDGIECIKVASTTANVYIASARTASRVNLEWGQTYIASCWLMFNEDVNNSFGDSVPLHFHAGSVATTNVFDLNILNHGGGVATYEIEPDASYGNTIPANTWVRFVRKIVTADSAPNADYPYPVFAPFIFGSLRKATTSNEHITWIRGFKVERGTVPTGWTPAPEDQTAYTDAQVSAAKAEIKVTTDGITSEVSKVSSAKYLTTSYSYTLSQIKTWAAEGHNDGWSVSSTENIRVGDVVYLSMTDTTRNCTVYVKGTVTVVNSINRITMTSHGYEDVLPVDTIKSTINQSSDSVKIQANHVEIDGTAIFTAISDDVDDAITGKGYQTAGQVSDAIADAPYVSEKTITAATDFNTLTDSGVYYIRNGSCTNAPVTNWGKLDVSLSGKLVQLFYPDALPYYYYRARTGSTWSAWQKVDGVGAAAAVQENLDNLKIGGRNYILNSAGVLASHLTSGNEYIAIDLGQSYMGIPEGTQVTVSFDLVMPVVTANPTLQVYNTNNDGPKCFRRDAGHGEATGPTRSFTAAVGTTISERVSYTGYIGDRDNPPKSSNYLEFYSVYGSGNVFSVANLKMEKGDRSSDWTPAPEDVAANAVKRTQRIYFRKSASGAPAAPGTASTNWVTNGNTESSWTKYNAWSTRVPPIAESAAEGATTYLYLYTCEQREMGDGTLAYTTVLLDDSTTIIDGGNIITGSVTANKLEVYDATIQKIRADAIDTASITVGQDQVDGLDETLDEKIPKSMSQLENDSGYVTDGYVPAAIPAAIVKGELQADQINVDSLRTALLQAANLLIGNVDEAHIVANGNRMSFMAGGHEVAYVQVDDEGGTFYMTRSIVVKDMQFGDGKWKWYKRDNNNMSLKWMGGM